jgi:hypothetical protein
MRTINAIIAGLPFLFFRRPLEESADDAHEAAKSAALTAGAAIFNAFL